MKYILVIPTFSGHLQQVELFLESFVRFCSDKKKIPVKLIISQNEHKAFRPLVNKFSNKISLEVVDLQTILQQEEGVDIQERALLKKVGKFNFQSLKKIYGVKYFEHDCALVLDSEALLVRPTQMKNVFDDYLKSKFIIYSKLGSDNTQKAVTKNALKILRKKYLDMWMFEYQYWFYEKSQVNHFFEVIKKTTKKSVLSNLQLCSPVFEFNLYAFFLFFYHRKEYQFINAAQLLKKYLGPKEFKLYQKNLTAPTLFEYFPWGLTEQNYKNFVRLYEDLKLHFFKYDDRSTLPQNTEVQQKFVQELSQVKLLPCRVVGNYFQVNGVGVPINHDLGKNQPIMNSAPLFNFNFSPAKAKDLAKKILTEIYFRKEQLLLSILEINIRPKFDQHQGVFLSRVIPKQKKKKLVVDSKLCFDVGAYTGNSIKRLRSLGYTKILCFEPNTANFLKLYRSFGNDKKIAFIRAAVSSKSDQFISFYQNPFLPWLSTVDSQWITHTRHKSLVPKLTETRVKTITLDETIELLGVIPDYIKIDVEGHELAVLGGLHYKPKLLSFEWISERLDQNLLVAKECLRLGCRKFYLSKEEEVPIFNKKNQLSFGALAKKWKDIQKKDTNNSSWGSIWCQ